MKWTGLNEIRESFLEFFESKDHLRLPSYSLVPQGDNTLLLINAGMAPLKKYFLGQSVPPHQRVVTCQKCIRTPDIERVGKTARHGTFFEMLGNFSFGDYFKREAVAWAWEYITKVLELPEERLYVTVYEDDDEAYDIWTKEIGVPAGRVSRFGKEDNFWEHGSLPCGPCSEIYFDRGEKYGCGRPGCKVGCDCDRYVEFWNIVFQQFDSDGRGHYTPLKKPNIDTGMGLERLACILQDVDNLFEVDTVRNIMKKVSEITGVRYGGDRKTDVSLRVITDHIRSTTFMVGDGVFPSNEGRGYVLRRLLRRAARHGRLLGVKGPFLSRICDTVIDESRTAYPELEEKREYIKRVIRMEEERFSVTIDQGLLLLSELTDKLLSGGGDTLAGADAFRLYDTFGFPVDLTRDILEERSLKVDEAGFELLMKEQREKARAARNAGGTDAAAGIADDDVPKTEFRGYGAMECEAQIKAVFVGGERAGFAKSGDRVSLILDRTVFYAESGGQVGDCGVLTTDTAVVRINGCKKSVSGKFVHLGEVISGAVSVDDRVTAKVDVPRRSAIMRNHSAAHLLQAALRRVLGDHVRQAGQLVDEKRVRFDFTHFEAMTPQEIAKVEAEVNGAVLSGLAVDVREMPIGEARKLGAMALFGEKYGDVVRVVKMGGYSLEFCGGTHVDNTAKIGLFKIISESSVAAGVRRIEAATGLNVLELLGEAETTIRETAQILKSGSADLAQRAGAVAAEIKSKDREIDILNGKIAGVRLESILMSPRDVKGVKLYTALLKDTNADTLRLMTDRIRESEPSGAAVLAGVCDGKLSFASCCGADAVRKGAHAGKLVKAVAAAAGGGGGGRPESATAGAKDPAGAETALNTAASVLEGMLK